MESLTVDKKLTKISNDIALQSFESRQFSYEDTINKYLDLINNYRKRIVDVTKNVDSLSSDFESLSWLEENEEIGENTLKKLNETLISGAGLIQVLKKDYVRLNTLLRQKGLCKNELNNYISSIRNLEESIDDIEAVFFRLPIDQNFQDALKALSSL